MGLKAVNKLILLWLFDKNEGEFRERDCVSTGYIVHCCGY